MAFWALSEGGAQPALLSGCNIISRADLAKAADEMARRLPDIGGRSFGFLLFDHDVPFVATYLACLRDGRHVPLLLQADLHPDFLASLADHYAPDWIFSPVETVLPKSYAEAWRGEGARLLLRRVPRDGAPIHPDLAILLSTSGSTGSRKLVRLSYDAIAANAKAIASYLSLQSDDRAITTLPLGYSFGMSILNSHLAAGASLVLTRETLMSRAFWSLAAETGVTSLSGVPSSFEMMRRAGLDRRGLNRLRMLTQAGGRLRTDLVMFFDQLARAQGWRFFVMYGQTEASPRISYVPPDLLGDKAGSIGIAIPGGRLSIDAETRELIYSGANVMLGYAETRDDLARADDLGGVLRTGDLARQDADGYFYLEGRLSRFVKISGTRINLDAVEEALSARLARPLAVTGNDDALNVILADDFAQPDTVVTDLMRELFNIFPGNVDVRRLEALPLLPNGKLDYRTLARLS